MNDFIKEMRELHSRIRSLESPKPSASDPAQNVMEEEAGVTVPDLAATITYMSEPVTRLPYAVMNISWGSPIGLPQDVTVAYYSISISESAVERSEYYQVIEGQSLVKRDAKLNTTYYIRVVAVLSNFNKSVPATLTTSTAQDTTAPPQPSTPALSAVQGGVVVKYDGKDSVGTAMPTDFKWVAVHYVHGGTTTFTPSTANFLQYLESGASTFIQGDSNYSTIAVRFVAYDMSNNVQPIPSTGATATPIKLVSSDLNVVLPGATPYSDTNNLVVDGSFEDANLRALRSGLTKNGTWTWDNVANMQYHGNYALKHTGDATTTKSHYINQNIGNPQISEIMVTPGSKLYLSVMIRGISSNGSVTLNVRWRDSANVLTTAVVASKTDAATGNYEVLEGVIAVPSTAKYAAIYFGTSNFTSGTWYFDSLKVLLVSSTVLIEDAAITTGKIQDLAVTNAKIQSMSVAKLLAGEIQAGSYISAGPVNGTHTVMDSVGLKAYRLNTEDNTVDEYISIGSGTDAFALMDNNNNTLFSVDSEGRIIGSSLSIPSKVLDVNGSLLKGLSIYGMEFTDWISPLPKGLIARVKIPDGASPPAAGTTAQPLLECSVIVPPYRAIRVSTGNFRMTCSTTTGVIQSAIRYSVDGSQPPFDGGASLGGATISVPTGFGGWPVYLSGLYNNLTTNPVTLRVILYYRALNAGYTAGVSTDSTELYAEDMGLALPETGLYRGNDIVTPPVIRYTSEWVANNGGTYRGDGSLRTDTTDMRQGYVGQSNGDQHGIALFTNNAVSGETTKTIAQALTMATVEKVEVYLYANFWYAYSGGTALISAHDLTSMSSATPNTTKVTASSWPRPGGRWVDITSIFTADKRGIWVGKTGTSNTLYYGWFNGPNAASEKPRLRITYRRSG